jgi:L-ascorbate metabolism protein UlaG (beta-lactamase superfamily)
LSGYHIFAFVLNRKVPVVRLIAAACLMSVLALTACSTPQQAPGKPWHHTSEGFRNPVGSPERSSWTDRLPWVLGRFLGFSLSAEAAPTPPGHVLPLDRVKAGLAATSGKNTVTWIGHMTALLRLDGKNVLTDPWLTDYASPVRPLGPKRYTPPALRVDQLPPIDFVVVSHSHFEHLDLPTIETLPNRDRITALVPLGLGRFFRDSGYGKVVELDWEQTATINGVTFTALPVIHWSKRSLFATNDTLWAGWAIQSQSGARVYFGGDAEYGPVYKDVAKRHGGFDLALLSIGAFIPRIVMNGSHCVPEDCLRISMDLGAHTHLGIHWGTVQLGDDKPADSIRRFRAGGRALGLPDDRVWLMKIGETRILPRRGSLQTP